MDEQLERIATAFEKIAEVLEEIKDSGIDLKQDSITANLQGPLLVQHEFTNDVPLGLLHVEPNQIDGFQIDVKK